MFCCHVQLICPCFVFFLLIYFSQGAYYVLRFIKLAWSLMVDLIVQLLCFRLFMWLMFTVHRFPPHLESIFSHHLLQVFLCLNVFHGISLLPLAVDNISNSTLILTICYFLMTNFPNSAVSKVFSHQLLMFIVLHLLMSLFSD